MKLEFNVDKTFNEGIKRFSKLYDFEICKDGITVRSEKGEKRGVSLKNKEAVIYYKEKPEFFRELCVLLENAEASGDFDLTEADSFDAPGFMLDASRGAVATVDTVKRMLDYLAAMGYGFMMLYTEDTVEIKSRPYFGYMRGRYTEEELREIDDYAYAYGIEMIPCIECYGHMGKYLMWEAAAPVKDTAEVLLAREEETFRLLDEWIGSISSCFRSKKIHVGMDEAWDMGRGVFLDKNGYVPPFDIFNEYMDRLMAITDKYGLKPMMWSDMYFRISSKSGRAYYDEDAVVPESVKAKIPKNIKLMFWQYGNGGKCDDYMLKKHMDLGCEVGFTGGVWTWNGHFPEYHLAKEATDFSLAACKKHGVRTVMTTVWSDDNAECNLFSALLPLSHFAERVYGTESDEELKARFKFVTGAEYDEFFTLSLYHSKFEREEYPDYTERFVGKAFFWQDIMEGFFDDKLFKDPMSAHYRECAERMRSFARRADKWKALYEYAALVFEYLWTKTQIAERLVPSYKAGDKKALSEIKDTLLPLLLERTKAVHRAHRTWWMSYNKPFSWGVLDVRYGGMAARCECAMEQIGEYLSGAVKTLPELEEPRLPRNNTSINRFGRTFTAMGVI